MLHERPFLKLLESRREVAQHRRLIGQAEPMNHLACPVQLDDRFSDIGDLHVRIDPTRDGQAHHLEFRMDCSTGCRLFFAEHHRADFHSSDPVFPIEGRDQRLGGKFGLRNVRQKFFGVEIDGMAPDRFENGHACLLQQLSR